MLSLIGAFSFGDDAAAARSRVYTERDLERYGERNEPLPLEKPAGRFKGTRITIDVENTDLAFILKLLSDIARSDGQKIVIVNPITVKGVSVNEKHKPWDELLDRLIRKYNLKSSERDGVLYISR